MTNAIAVPTRTNLNDWARGSASTYKILADGRIFFIQDDAEGFHLFAQRFTGRGKNTTRALSRGTFATAAEARREGDRLAMSA